MMIAAAASSGAPTWLILLAPMLTVGLTALIAFAAFYPHTQARKARQAQRMDRERRLDATADAVLGRDADPRVGQRKQVGLVDTTRILVDTVGTVNGDGRTVMDHLHTLQTQFTRHEEADTARFAEVNRRITSMGASE